MSPDAAGADAFLSRLDAFAGVLDGGTAKIREDAGLGVIPPDFIIDRMLPQIRSGGTAVVLVEQDIARALRAADRFYCLQEGRVTLSGKPDDVDQDTIRAAYFGA